MAKTSKKTTKKSARQQKSGFLTKRKVLFISIGVGLTIWAVGIYLLSTYAASTYVSFVGVGNKCLDNDARRKVNGNKIQLYTCNGTTAQQWQVNTDGSITNANGFCLDVAGAGTAKGTLVQLYECNHGVGQKWTVDSNTGTIVNPHSGLCLDDQYAKTDDRNQIWMYPCNGTAAQKWTMKKATETPPPSNVGRKHFIQNTQLSDAKTLQGLGYNVIDATTDDIGSLGKLPSGMQVMVWTGDAFCTKGITPWTSFKKVVSDNRSNSKIYGYFLIDEPNARSCKNVVTTIRDRADYIHCLAIRSDTYSNGQRKVADDGTCLDSSGRATARKTDKKAYFVDEYSFDYAKVRQSYTHADIFAIDPYPCRPNGCNYTELRERIARAKQYYPASAIAPTYQAFGGDGWKMPSPSEMRAIQNEFDKALTSTTLDVTYSYRDNKSGGPSDTYPGLIHASSSLKDVMKAHNQKYN